MPLHTKSISISAAAVCFFGIAVICWTSNLSAFTCCKRALMSAFIVYVTAALAVKAINTILMNAMINSQINRQKENDSDSEG